MSDLTLGTTPARLTVWLVDAAPFAASVTADAAFPAPPELVFDTGTVWPATLDEDGLAAAWLHPAGDVDALVSLSPRRVTLRDPATHHVWAHGTVYVARVVDSGVPSTVAPGGSITVEQLDGNVSITYGDIGVSDHGALTGLEDDDHPQYLTEARGDARYAPSHESILLEATATLPAAHPVLTVRATEPSTVAVADAPDGTVITVHVAEGWQHITWAPGIIVTGEAGTTETWVVLVRTEGVWQALVSGQPTVQDTGPVNLKAMLIPRFRDNSTLTIQRTGNLVILDGTIRQAEAGSGLSYSDLLTGSLPVGYWPTSTKSTPAAVETGTERASVSLSGDWAWLYVNFAPATVGSANFVFTMVYYTTDPFPTP